MLAHLFLALLDNTPHGITSILGIFGPYLYYITQSMSTVFPFSVPHFHVSAAGPHKQVWPRMEECAKNWLIYAPPQGHQRHPMQELQRFRKDELRIVNEAVAIAEEMTSNVYKMSSTEWRGQRYDIKTLADLTPDEVVHGPFAQIIRYIGRKPETSLSSSEYDFYKICLQDHTILTALRKTPALGLFAFMLYIVTHELIHVIRFTKFLQAFDASATEKIIEEARVHEKTQAILKPAKISGMEPVFDFYRAWQGPLDALRDVP
jgi:hypothetical protein